MSEDVAGAGEAVEEDDEVVAFRSAGRGEVMKTQFFLELEKVMSELETRRCVSLKAPEIMLR